MNSTLITNVYAQYGIFGIICVAFFVLVFWIVRAGKEREEKLYAVIKTLSDELPDIKHSLDEIRSELRLRKSSKKVQKDE